MNKLAAKQAEVRGALAALVDAGYVKVASENDFDVVADAVEQALPMLGNYDMTDVLSKTAEIMEEVYEVYGSGALDKRASDEDMEELEKIASEVSEQDILAAYGSLTLQKEAGDISEFEFAKEAGKLNTITDMMRGAGSKVTGGARSVGRQILKGLKGEGIRDSYKATRGRTAKLKGLSGAAKKSVIGARRHDRKDLLKALGRSGAVYGGGAAGVAGAYQAAKDRELFGE